MQTYRSTIWFFKGLNHFTKGGYEKAAKTFKTEETDMTNKTVVITGGNSGLGKQTAITLSNKGAKVYIVCRSKERGEEAVKEIKNGKVYVMDLSLPKSVSDFVSVFEKEVGQCDVLVFCFNLKINNAGCMVNEKKMTEDGIDVNFATNTLGTFYLTQKMLPLLKKSKDARVITVSSGGMYVQKMTSETDFNDKNYDGTMIYAKNKRQQVELTHHWANENPSIKFFSMHPGWADTPAVRSSMPQFYEKMKNKLRSVEQGADSIIWLACTSDLPESGSFVEDREAVSEHMFSACTQVDGSVTVELVRKMEEMLSKIQSE